MPSDPKPPKPLLVIVKKCTPFLSKNWLSLLLIAAGVGCMFWAGNMLAAEKQTPKEIGQATFILTAASIFISVLATKIYARIGFDETLRDHGVQIARAIRVLQNEMAMLQSWVAQKRISMSGSTRSYELIDSTFEHIEHTMRGFQNMTGTALGGVTGVIGDAVAQYEALMAEMAKVRSDASRETAELEEEIESAGDQADIEELQDKLRRILEEKEARLSALALASGVPPLPEPPKQSFSARCPYCFQKNSIQVINKKGETRPVACGTCGKTFNTHVVAGNRLEVRPLVKSELTTGGNEEEAIRFWEVTSCRVLPSQLKTLVRIVVGFHQHEKEKAVELSPYGLQQAMFSEQNTLAQNDISNGTVRNFFKAVKIGNGFTFLSGVAPNFKTRYINELDEKGLLESFIKGSIIMLAKAMTITDASAEPLTRILLPDDLKTGRDLVNGALRHLGWGKV